MTTGQEKPHEVKDLCDFPTPFWTHGNLSSKSEKALGESKPQPSGTLTTNERVFSLAWAPCPSLVIWKAGDLSGVALNCHSVS